MSKKLYDINTYLNEKGGIEVEIYPSEQSYTSMELQSDGKGLARQADAYNYFNPVNCIFMKGILESQIDEAVGLLKKEWKRRIQILLSHVDDISIEVKKYLEERE